MAETRNLTNLFGQYVIEDKIGAGGMAVVYRVHDKATQQRLALKMLHAFLTAGDDAELKRRFQREAQIFASLDHPNIVRIYDYGDHNGTPYLAMEYMSGGSLAQRFSEPTPVSLKTSAHLLNQIAAGLDYAHAQGIIHRDLKLENILLDDYNRPALADFGIARVRDATRLTATSIIVGTPMTMSPEQAVGSPNLDYRSDLYALAVMAYLMATGFFPFTGDEPLAILNKHLNALAPTPSKVNPQLPPMLDVVLLKGLSKRPDDRYQSAGEFATAFDEAVSQMPYQTSSLVQVSEPNPIAPVLTQIFNSAEIESIPAPTANGSTPVFRPRRKSYSALLGLALLLVLALAIVAFTLGRPTSPVVAQEPSATPSQSPTFFDPDGTVSFFMGQTIAAYTDTPTATATDTPTNTKTATATLTKTPLATATRTPLPFGNAEVTGRFDVNVRAGPSTEHPIWFTLAPGTRVQLVGRTEDATWLDLVTQDSRRGWMAAQFLIPDIDIWTLPITWFEPTATATFENPIPTSDPGGGGSGGGGGGNPTAVPTNPPTATNAPPPISITFYAEPERINPGGCSTLYWSVSNADEAYLDNSPVELVGSSVVCPSDTTTYSLSAYRYSDGATAGATATVTVVKPSVTAVPSTDTSSVGQHG